MRFAPLFFLIALAAPLLVSQNGPAPQPDKRLAEIRARRERGEVITPEDRDYVLSAQELQMEINSAAHSKAWAGTHPTQDSTGLIPLPDLGKGKYKGEQGGLYPNGENTIPAAHLKAGLALAKSIRPLDKDGQPSATGKMVLLSIGMSNTTQEFRSFLTLAKAHRSELNPKLAIVDGAQSSQTAAMIVDPNLAYWNTPLNQLKDAGLTPAQVQIIWLKEADKEPKEAFPIEVKKLQAEYVTIIHHLRDKYPNTKMVYISPRIYGGYSLRPLNPEPHAYETGFAVKWLIADQINSNPELNYDRAKGPVRAAWMAWGPYIWADGVKPNKAGLVWLREDLSPDGVHPSVKGREKVAQQLLEFFQKDSTAVPWFSKH
jgi:hypothetical protein